MFDKGNGGSYYGIDIAKVLFCIMVVAIHTMGSFGPYPYLRIAVPMFFCISSFLFFQRCDGTNDVERLKRFLVRNIKLYSFWFVVLFFPTLIFGGWLHGNILANAVKFIAKIFVGSTFAASWYIPALMVCVSIVYWCSRKVPTWVMIFVTLTVYVFCCVASNYRGFLSEDNLLYKLILIYPGTVYNSFPVGLFWVVLGKCIADGGVIQSRKILYAGEVISLFLLVGEYHIINKWNCMVDNDCYFMLIPVCIFLLHLICSAKVQIRPESARYIRNMSTIIYCVHGTLATALNALIFTEPLSIIDCIVLFATTLLGSFFVATIVLNIGKKTGTKLIRWAY